MDDKNIYIGILGCVGVGKATLIKRIAEEIEGREDIKVTHNEEPILKQFEEVIEYVRQNKKEGLSPSF